MYSTVPLFKSHFSLGKSILTLEKPSGKENTYPVSVFDLAARNNLPSVVLVEDSISGLLQASKNAEELKISLIFGIRIDITDDMEQKDDPSLLKRAKYIIMAKNSEAYKTIVKIWSIASSKGFYYSPSIDFKTLKTLWNENLMLCVPFYDSFLFLNSLCSHCHVPDFDSLGQVTFFTESNELPFDDILLNRVNDYCSSNSTNHVPSQSIFYKSPDDYLAYVAFKCLHNKGHSQRATIERPELDHMSSDLFNFDRWLTSNKF